MADITMAANVGIEFKINRFGVATRSIEDLAAEAVDKETNPYKRMILLYGMDQRFGRDARLAKVHQMLEIHNLLTGESRLF